MSGGLLMLALGLSADDTELPIPTMSINDLMLTVVAPATDTIWGIDDPQSDSEWQIFIDAADTVIEAGKTIKAGGTGPNDNDWATSEEWQAFADRLIAAGVVARTAAEQQDLEGMYTAGEVIYPPCEECHIQFHPGVQGDQ
jgi:hypothetical protein